ncbi:MAG: M14 family zinc carboxypeptidase [Bacteroidia bacterium]
MQKNILFIVLLFVCFPLIAQEIQLRVNNNETLTYEEVIAAYALLDKKYPEAKLIECGLTDIGRPLHVFVISKSKEFNPSVIKKANKLVWMIMNGIHPGEPEGIDASLFLADKWLKEKAQFLDNVVVCIIPVYNVDGALNRNSYSRANQNGPKEYGFRGNARNLDLNRDFVKCDSENAKSFQKIFHTWNPDVFLDNHTSNGADYQHTFTLIATQHNKLGGASGKFLHEKMEPELYRLMKEKKWDMVPYVNTKYPVPDSGLIGFLETPRYSTGYAALFGTIGFVSETHMLKSFENRYKATVDFMEVLANYNSKHATQIIENRKATIAEFRIKENYPLQWEIDTLQFQSIDFKGFEASYIPSQISNAKRLYYDRYKPFTKSIPFYNYYNSKNDVVTPKYYIVPQAWKEVIERLKWNNVQMSRFEKDTMLSAEVYYIESYKTASNPYEGHYLHYDTKVIKHNQNIKVYKGDYLVSLNQEGVRYIVETLEPEADDSFFNWNFFDEILMQKEWFSDYIFEEKALEILNTNTALKQTFETKKKEDEKFANDYWGQLYFIYKNSPYYEKSHMRYPVYRVVK